MWRFSGRLPFPPLASGQAVARLTGPSVKSKLGPLPSPPSARVLGAGQRHSPIPRSAQLMPGGGSGRVSGAGAARLASTSGLHQPGSRAGPVALAGEERKGLLMTGYSNGVVAREERGGGSGELRTLERIVALKLEAEGGAAADEAEIQEDCPTIRAVDCDVLFAMLM